MNKIRIDFMREAAKTQFVKDVTVGVAVVLMWSRLLSAAATQFLRIIAVLSRLVLSVTTQECIVSGVNPLVLIAFIEVLCMFS